MRPLILISNDDGVNAKGLHALEEIAAEFGDVVVMAPLNNLSGQSHSITGIRPLRVREERMAEGRCVYSCDGTPVDCIKMATEHFCPRPPDLVLSGINHGSNSSINVIYSGTMGAVLEATMLGFKAIGFSLLSHNPDADFEPGVPYVRHLIGHVLQKGLPEGVSLNVNIPKLPKGEIRGIRICHQSKAQWRDSFTQRIDPQGRPYWWLTGKFECNDPSTDSDEWALTNGYVSVVPVHTDLTRYDAIGKIQNLTI